VILPYCLAFFGDIVGIRRENGDHHFPHRALGGDVVVEKPYMHTHRVKLLDDLDHVRRITAKPVQLGDQDNVAFPDVYLQGLKAG